jgi:sugar/nucleoside kinase (ribokinase family)
MRPSGLFVGLTTLDVVHTVGTAPGPNEKTTARRQEIAAGGPAANAAVTFAALGGDATLITALGTHALARVAADELASRGVTVVDATPTAVVAPPVSLVRVVDATGERSVSSTNASGVTAAPPAGIDARVSSADVVLVDGHHAALALAAAAAARQAHVPVLLDGGSWKPSLRRLMTLVDAAICSADFTAPGGLSTVDNLLGAGVASVAVTHGSDPIIWVTRDERGTISLPRVPVRDTLGAGDTFHGAAAFAMARGDGWRTALEFAATVAAVRVQHPGPRDWLLALHRR